MIRRTNKTTFFRCKYIGNLLFIYYFTTIINSVLLDNYDNRMKETNPIF